MALNESSTTKERDDFGAVITTHSLGESRSVRKLGA